VSLGSRNNPYVVTLAPGQESSYGLSVKLTSSDVTSFHYPVTVEAAYTGGALEGSVHWKGKENGPQVFVLKNESELANLTVTATSKCDAVNRPDGSCSDYVYIRIFNNGETRPNAKKRFYVRVKSPKATAE